MFAEMRDIFGVSEIFFSRICQLTMLSVPQHRFQEGATHFHHETFQNGESRTHTRHHHGVLGQSIILRDSQLSIHNLRSNGSRVSSQKNTAPTPVCPIDMARARASAQSMSKISPMPDGMILRARGQGQKRL